MKIALDAMGGDHAPTEVIAGALGAVLAGFVEAENLVLVGDQPRIEAELKQQSATHELDIHHAPEVIGMDEHPGLALRRKRNSSIVVGARLLRENQVGALVSAGNTGAMVAAGTLLVKLLPGVRRPGIAATFATAGGPVTLIDVGANIHCLPEDLYAYGQMASAYRSGVDGIEAPRIGLLSIGEEDAKGGPLIKQTRALFNASSLNFIGNVEGQDLFSGRCDVVVCEGFVGNVVLKVSEGLGSFMSRLLSEEVRKHAHEAEGGVWKQVGKALFAKTDYAEYGGAPLLGVDGLIIICHGRSDRRAVANALRVSRQYLDAKVNQKIVSGLARSPLQTRASDGGGGPVPEQGPEAPEGRGGGA
jgi:glycerol-3-phosphate acyltransferase PlsX